MSAPVAARAARRVCAGPTIQLLKYTDWCARGQTRATNTLQRIHFLQNKLNRHDGQTDSP